MKLNKEVTETFRGYGFSVVSDKAEHVAVKGSLAGVLKLTGEIDTSKFTKNSNKAKEMMGDNDPDRISFCGGTYQEVLDDLSGKVDMKPFLKAREKFAKGKLAEKLKTSIALVTPRRKRIMSEHDGDWDYSRRYEITPFANTKRAMGAGRTIDLVCDFSISAYTTSEEIDRYGAMIWAISDLIEQAGVATNIIYRDRVTGMCSERKLAADIEVTVKRAGEYISPSVLASVFKSRFYRRVMFGLFSVIPELVNRRVCSGLGRPVEDRARIEFSNGKLVLNPLVIGATNDQVEEEILKAIGAKLGAVA
jgi:hypothetical protein